jgi:ABC-2 type transport system ATP-binding protein
MTVAEFLYFIAEIRGKRGAAVRVASEAMRETCDLSAVWNQPIETLSKGYRQRVGFAQALIHDPPVLILDEPTDGLDPNQKHEVRNLIKNMGSNKTIILSTHILEEVEAICQRVVIIAQGNIVADATPGELRQQSKFHNAVTMKIPVDQIEKARALLSGIGGVGTVELFGTDNDMLRVYPKQGEPIALRISEVSRKENLSIQQLQVEQGRLDEVFRKVTKSQLHQKSN